MNSRFYKIVALVSCLCVSYLMAQNDYDSLINKGVFEIYNIEFEKAASTFLELKNKYPEKPAGLFMEAMTLWWEILLDLKNEENDDRFYDKIEEVVDFCDTILDKDELNSDALFFKGGALGFRGLLNSLRKNWFDAAGDGADALPLVNKVYEIDTTNVDVKLGFGIYNYFAVALPEQYPVAKPLLFFIPEGNKTQGLKDLENVSVNGKYTSVEARFTLGKIYYLYEKNYSKSEECFLMLNKDFPNNPVFERYYARTLISKYGYNADSIFTRIYKKCQNNVKGYNQRMKREALYYTGMKYKNQTKPEEALKFFNECAEISEQVDIDEESGFWINSLLYCGMMNDVLGKREIALKLYKKVLDMNEYKMSQEKAERYIKMPYKMQGFIKN